MTNYKPPATDDTEDLRARLTVAEYFARITLQGYHALQAYGVNFMDLREWKENSILEDAWKLKPRAAQEHIMAYLERLGHAIRAAVNRKTGIKLVTDNSSIYPET